jgi:hypothetical protein
MLKYREIISKDQIHNIVIKQYHIKKDKNYKAILTAQKHKDEQKK